ncbi:hypothetical protein N0V90_004474 [Kalmusia sp. IMI 367209]|nr:hypothetical protein N0V90_004474 [Kalmusia sp. IMI 367209]
MASSTSFDHSNSGVQVGNNYGTLHNTFHSLPNLDQILNDLPNAEAAQFNAYRREHDEPCLVDTRVDLLQEIYQWAGAQDAQCICWLSGMAGTGKSTVARTVARKYYEKGCLAASFFFSRDDGDINHAGNFVTSIAWQLAHTLPASRQHICDAIRSGFATHTLRDQWRHLIIGPLSKLNGSNLKPSYTLVIDALDECDNANKIRTIVQLILEVRSLQKVRLRVFLTSRSEMPIRKELGKVSDAECRNFALQNISSKIVDHDIALFLKTKLCRLGEDECLDIQWPGEEAIKSLVRRASGLFIWASTACLFIQEGDAQERLCALVGKSNIDVDSSPEANLNQLYIKVLQHTVRPKCTAQEKSRHCGKIREVLGSIVVLLSILSSKALGRLICISKQEMAHRLRNLHAILDIHEEEKDIHEEENSRPIRLHHPSFRDFLLDRERCSDANFWVDGKQAHQSLAGNCIKLMSESLKQDICCFKSPGTLVAEVKTEVKQHLPAELQYACLYWIQHIQKSGIQPSDNDKSNNCPSISSFIHDAKRFVLYNRAAIELAPHQTYSGLMFAPTTSIIRMQFRDIPKWILTLPRVEEEWKAMLQTLEGHMGEVTAIAFSQDGKTLASASTVKTKDTEEPVKTIKLWDAGSGVMLQTLEGHMGKIQALAFSQDGKTLASASLDTMVRLWDTDSLAVLRKLEGHRLWVSAVAFSQDGKTLASASGDATIKLWNVESGAVLLTLQGHGGCVNTVAFSPNRKTLASASANDTVKLWNIDSGALLGTFNCHTKEFQTNDVRALAFLEGGKTLALADVNKRVMLCDTGSGVVLQKLKGCKVQVSTMAFSPDGKTLALALISGKRTVELWDTDSGAVLQTLKGHIANIGAVAFSPDGKTLASASGDMTIKLWDAVRLCDAGSGAVPQTLEGHSEWVTSIAFSLDGKTLASASGDKTVKLWNTDKGKVLQTLKGHTSEVQAVTFSPDDKTLASASADMTVKLWAVKPRNVGSSSLLRTLGGHTAAVKAVAFSPNGKMLASASADMTVKLWDTIDPWDIDSGSLMRTLKGHGDHVKTVVFSPDNTMLASASIDKRIKVWDRHEYLTIYVSSFRPG